jgi:hypothetical protein
MALRCCNARRLAGRVTHSLGDEALMDLNCSDFELQVDVLPVQFIFQTSFEFQDNNSRYRTKTDNLIQKVDGQLWISGLDLPPDIDRYDIHNVEIYPI